MAQNVKVEMASGEMLTAAVRNPDRVRWDITASKHKWPSFSDAAFLGMTFMSWAALKRTGQYSGEFEKFRDEDCLDIEMVDDEGNPLTEADLAGE